MKKISYSKTGQYRDTSRAVSMKAAFVGLDENGEPIYDGMRPKPTITFEGTVKLHGTNAGVSVKGNEVWVQSRNRVINTLTGHMGFAEFVHHNKETFISMAQHIGVTANIDSSNTITLYGEWCGQGIQKGVAISGIPQKSFFLFAVKATGEDGNSSWLPQEFLSICCGGEQFEDIRVYVLRDMWRREIEIDFNNPQLSTNELIEHTNEVEAECPIAHHLTGIKGVGEGVVWTGWYEGERHIFKVKGEKHSTSKVKKLANVDPEKIQNISEFVDYAVTDNRVVQAMQEVSQGNTDSLTKKSTPDILRWIANDIIEEESDVLVANKLEWKDVARDATDRARRIFFSKIEMV